MTLNSDKVLLARTLTRCIMGRASIPPPPPGHRLSFRISGCSRQWIGGCRSNLNAAYALQKDFCQQSRAAAAICNLSSFWWHVTLAMVWARKPKVLPQKYYFKAMSYGKCGARNTWIYFIAVLYYSTGRGQNILLDTVYYSIGLR